MLENFYDRMLTDLKSVNFIEEFILGSCAGFAICAVGHPFDTIKTRMQNNNKSLTYTVVSTIKNEGVLAFYKGIASPLLSTPLINAIVFSSYEISKIILKSNTNFSEINTMILAGGVAGFTNAFIAGPVELFKTKMQVQTVNPYYKSYTDIALKLYNVSGFRGWFQGTCSTILRDTISIAAQFGTYEYVLRMLEYKYGVEKHERLAWHYLLAGSLAGINCWLSSYPIDVAKSRIQAKILNEKVRFRLNGFLINELRDVYKNHGIKGLFAGVVPIMGRAALGNAVGFWAWEKSKVLLRGKIN